MQARLTDPITWLCPAWASLCGVVASGGFEWQGQAWLRLHLGEDYAAFEKATGITSREELKDFVYGKGAEGAAQLAATLPPPLPEKLGAVCVLLKVR